MGFNIINTKVEWLAEAKRPSEGDGLVIPSNDHLWMTVGPGLELKKSMGKEIELEAVRQGPVEPGAVVQTEGSGSGYRKILHAAVLDQHNHWVEGAGRRAAEAMIAMAEGSKLTSLVVHPFHRGAPVHAPSATAELFAGLIASLERGSTVKKVTVLVTDAEEQALFQQAFVQALSHRS